MIRIRRPKMFVILHGLIAFVFCFTLGRWFFAEKTQATITTPYAGTVITAKYTVTGKTYSREFMRYDIPFNENTITVRYLPNRPGVSRVNSFMGILAEPLAWWGVFIIGTVMLLLVDNVVFSKSTVFVLQKRFPWIHMEEFFPFNSGEDQPNTFRPQGVRRKKLFRLGR
jgi:hypothetical protein